MNMFKSSIIVALTTLVTSIVTLMIIPEGTQLPIHWNSSGEADRIVGANFALMVPPTVMLLVIGVLAFLKYLEPRRANLEQSSKAVSAICLAIMLMMAIMEAGYIALLNGIEFSMHLLVIFSVGLTLMIIGNYLSKTRSNFFIGIRTPWTLSSDEIWHKTHRLAGKLLMLAGGITAMSCWFIPQQNLTYLIMGVIVPAAIIPTVYSWWLWHKSQKAS